MSEKGEVKLVGVDRGWSWVIAFSCFFGSLVLAGIFRTSGVLFVAFISTYGVNREAASWPMVVCIAVLNLTGPFSGILGQRFGIRPVVIVGALIATIGISSCYFTTSLKVITFLFGGVFGIGYGFINTLMPVILNSYFLNLRATANGIANSGSCIGSIILPILFEQLIAAYGLSGCFLLTGSLVLHLTIAGALMRPPPWLKSKSNNKQKDLIKYKIVPTEQVPETVTSGYGNPESQNMVCLKESNCIKTENKISDDFERTEAECLINKDNINLSILPTQDSKVKDGNRKTSSGSSSKIVSSAKESTTNILPLTVFQSFCSVLSCPMFYVTAVTNVCFYFLYHMYVVIIVDYALDREVLDSDAKNILFAFAISDLFGRLCLGWITDRKFITRSRFVMLCMLLIGMVFFAFPYATGYATLIVVSCLYGLLLGCTMVVFPILLVDFCGIELHAVAYGCMCFMNGFASFARPFLIGYFRDSIGSYSSMFYILGAFSITSAAFWLLEICFVKKRTMRSQLAV